MEKQYEFYTKKGSARLTSRDKKKCRKQLKKDFQELGWELSSIDGNSGLYKVKNLFVGNMKSAKVVITVPYDTPPKVYWPNPKYYPLNGNRSNLKGFLPLYGPALIIYAIIFIILSFQNQILPNEIMRSLFSVGAMVILIFMMYYLLHGFTNKHNATRNSASIIAALEIAKSLSKDDKRKVAFLFTDKNIRRHAGAKVAMEEFKNQEKNPTIIALNCIGTGKDMAIGYLANSRKVAQEINRKLKVRLKQVQIDNTMCIQSPMEHFLKAVMISAGTFDDKNELCVAGTGTGKDCHIDDENIAKVVQMIITYIQAI